MGEQRDNRRIEENDAYTNSGEESPLTDLRDAAIRKAASSTTNYVSKMPRRMVRRFIFSVILMFSLAPDLEKQRMLRRLERGSGVGCYHMFFGEKFSLFSLIRMVIFFGLLAAAIIYLWQSGIIADFMAQQRLLEQITGTSTP